MNKNYLSIYAKSFNWAGFFLPKNTYLDCSKLYDFCRTADNIADDQNSLELKNKIFNGLYFVGAGTHPGAGVPGVLSSAKVLDKIL